MPNSLNLIAKCTSDEVYVEYYGILGKMYNSNLTPLEIFEKSRQLSDDYFDFILTRDDVQKTKPNPEVYNKIADKLGVSKNEILIIEDSLIGVQAAKASQIDVAVIYDKYSDNDREQITSLSTYQFKLFGNN